VPQDVRELRQSVGIIGIIGIKGFGQCSDAEIEQGLYRTDRVAKQPAGGESLKEKAAAAFDLDCGRCRRPPR